MQCSGHWFLYLAGTPNVTVICNCWSHNMKPLVRCVSRVLIQSGGWRSPDLCPTSVRPSCAYNTSYSYTTHHSILRRLFNDSGVAVLGSIVESVSLVRYICVLSSPSSRSYQWFLLTQHVQHISEFLAIMQFGLPLVLAQNLVYGRGIFHGTLSKATTHHRYTALYMCSNS